MEAIYPYANIIHLILAIIFLGYVFSDLAIISTLKDKFSKETQKEINQTLGKRSFKIFPLTLLLLVLTGGMMMSKYINSEAGFFETGVAFNPYKKMSFEFKHLQKKIDSGSNFRDDRFDPGGFFGP